jgi:hypothetical protein
MKIRLRNNSGWRSYRYLIRDVDRFGKTRLYLRRKGQPKTVLRETPAWRRQRAFRFELTPPALGRHPSARTIGSDLRTVNPVRSSRAASSSICAKRAIVVTRVNRCCAGGSLS